MVWYSHLSLRIFHSFLWSTLSKALVQSMKQMFVWNYLAFSMIQWKSIWSLVSLLFLNPSWKSGSSQFMYCWSLQFSSVTQLCPTLWDPIDCSTPGFPVRHQLLELAQTHVHQVGDVFQPSHPLLSPYPPIFNLSQHQGLFQWVSSSHQVAKVLEF